MDDEHLDAIVARVRAQKSDDGRVEIKTAVGGVPVSMWNSVSAFANTHGGTVILGLSEEAGFTPAPDFDATRIANAVESGLNANGKPQVTPVPTFTLDLGVVEGAPVVILEISPLNPNEDPTGPCYVTTKGPENGSYKRLSDMDKKLSRYEIYLIRSKWSIPLVDKEPVRAMTSQELNADMLQALFQRLRTMGSRVFEGTTTEQERLVRLNVLNDNSEITLAGALTFGKYPQQYFPQLVIDVAVHPSTQKSPDGTLRFLDRQICDGPLPVAIKDAVNRVLANLKTARVVDGVGGHDLSEIPETVLREAITNAVMHRDYSEAVRGQQVAVDVYPDRVEVTNPGGLWGDRTIENLDEGRSTSRNPVLANLLHSTPSADGTGVVAENQGSGIRLMKNVMTARGLPQPHFEADISRVRVTLQRHGLLNPATRQWLDSLPESDHRSGQDDLTLAFARDRGHVRVKDLRQELGLDSDEARHVLGRLLADGLISGTGDGPYQLVTTTREISGRDQEILAALSPVKALSVHELAEHLGKTPTSLRPRLRHLVEMGLIVPTAPPTSRNRKYLARPESPDEQ